jgi:hypothetical protein
VFDHLIEPLGRKDNIRLLRSIPQPKLCASTTHNDRQASGTAVTQDLSYFSRHARRNHSGGLSPIHHVINAGRSNVLSAHNGG